MSKDPAFVFLALMGIVLAAIYHITSADRSVFLFVLNAVINIGVAAVLYKIFMKGGE